MSEEHFKRIIQRERLARKQAEIILEDKSLELYESNKKLQELNSSLEQQVHERTAEIASSEERHRILFENHPFSLLVYSLDDYQILGVNNTAIERYGYTESEFKSKTIIDLHPEDQQDEVRSHLDNKEFDKDLDWIHILSNGDGIIVKAVGNDILYDGVVARFVVVEDVTDIRRIEYEKQVNEARYRNLIETASDIIYRCTGSGHFSYVNPTAIRVTGYTEKELLGKHFSELIPLDHRPEVITYYENQMKSRTESTYMEFPIITKSGKEIWIGQKVDMQFDNVEMEFTAFARDITDRMRAQLELERSEEKYRNIMENMELGLLEVNNDDIITDVYPKFLELSGYERDELVGKNATETLLPKDYHEFMEGKKQNRVLGGTDVYEAQLRRKDGSKTWVIISGAPYYGPDGEVAGSIGIHLDISDRKQMEDDLIEAKDLAEESMKSKELFMANMSHEIRTPMNAIIGMGELLQKTDMSDKQLGYVEAIKTSADNLLVIINDILDFSKIESGNLILESIPTNIPKLVDDVYKTCGLKAEEKGLQISLDISPEIGFYEIDPVRLSQILINLAGNAIKFTEKGQVRICCELNKKGESEDELRFSVWDTGIGISEEQKEKVFKSFIQAEESTSRKYGGTGLGLAISSQLVNMMGGQLELDSELGKGSEFYFTLKLPQVEHEFNIRANKEVEIDKKLLSGTKILLVEDHEINKFMAQTILEGWECEVQIAENGKLAIDAMEDGDFDLILMDIRMPVMDGITATRILRSEKNVTIPIIALTANAMKGDAEKYFEVGMNAYCSKPFKQEELFSKIAIQLGKVEVVEPEKKENEEPEECSALMDLSGLRLATQENEGFMKKMIELFLERTPETIEELKEAMERQNRTAVSGIVHKLKPSIDALACKPMGDLVRKIELSEVSFVELENMVDQFSGKVNQLMEELKGELV